MSRTVTMPVVLPTWVRADSHTIPKTGFCAPAGCTDTAARPSSWSPCQRSSCGGWTVKAAPSCVNWFGQGKAFGVADDEDGIGEDTGAASVVV